MSRIPRALRNAIDYWDAVEVAPGRYATTLRQNPYYVVASEPQLIRMTEHDRVYPHAPHIFDDGCFDGLTILPGWWTPEKRSAFAVSTARFPYDARRGDDTGEASDNEAAALDRALAHKGSDFNVGLRAITADLTTGEENRSVTLTKDALEVAIDRLGAIEVAPQKYAVKTGRIWRIVNERDIRPGFGWFYCDKCDHDGVDADAHASHHVTNVAMPFWWTPEQRFAWRVPFSGAQPFTLQSYAALYARQHNYVRVERIAANIETGEEIPA